MDSINNESKLKMGNIKEVRERCSYGSVICVSFYNNHRYSSEIVERIYKKLIHIGAKTLEVNFYSIDSDNVTYDKIMDSTDEGSIILSESRENISQLKNYLETKVLYSTEMIMDFSNGSSIVWLRPFITSDYGDSGGYDIEIDSSYSFLIKDPWDSGDKTTAHKNIERIKVIAQALYESGDFLYGVIREENFAPILIRLIKGDAVLPTNWVFYSKELLNILNKEKVLSLLSNCAEVKKFEKGGIFFRWDNLIEKVQADVTGDYRKFQEYIRSIPKEKYLLLK